MYGFARVMEFYNPWVGYFSVFIAVIHSLVMPMFGFLIANLMFTIVLGAENPLFVPRRNYWIGMGCLIMVITGIMGFIAK